MKWQKELSSLLGEVEKRFGKGAVITMTEGTEKPTVDVFSTGSVGLDHALGIGGLPYGRIVEVYGPESSGKTTLMLHAAAEVQKAGKLVAFVDAEHALDLQYAEALGVDLATFLVSQPDSGEQAFEIAEIFARRDEVGLVIIDSVAALTPQAEIDGEMGDHHVGLQARMMGKGLRKITALANRHQTTLMFTNQIRQKIGVMFGSPETTTGGNALKFYASVRLDIRRIGGVKGADGTFVGNKTRVKVAKNKLGPPFKTAEFDIMYGRGFCTAGELLDWGLELGEVQRSGAWFAMGKERLGQGREKAREHLLSTPELRKRLRKAVLASLDRPSSKTEEAHDNEQESGARQKAA